MGKWTVEQQKAHRETWVKALRSGEYQQAQGILRNSKGYCCLGVACDLAIKSGEVPEIGNWSTDDVGRIVLQVEYPSGQKATFCGLPPREVADYFGLVSVRGDVKDDTFPTLPRLNDGYVDHHNVEHKPVGFDVIADAIEKNDDRFVQEGDLVE